jgi:hypothetical protein
LTADNTTNPSTFGHSRDEEAISVNSSVLNESVRLPKITHRVVIQESEGGVENRGLISMNRKQQLKREVLKQPTKDELKSKIMQSKKTGKLKLGKL